MNPPQPAERRSRLDVFKEGAFSAPSGKRGRLVVGIDKLVEDPHNERKIFRNMEGLIASVRANGLVEPLTVTPIEDGRYQINTGHRRYRAAKAASLAEIEVIIRDPEEERVRRRKSLVSNLQREDIGPVDMAEALQGMLEEDEAIKTQADLAKIMGVDESWISQMLRILTLPDHLRMKVETSQLSLPYDAIGKIARVKDAALQEQLVDELLSGASNRDIRERIREASGGKAREEGTSEAPKPKPKKVYHTSQKVTVIVQSENLSLTDDRAVAALQEALRAARKAAKE